MIPNHLVREILVAEGFKLHDVNGEQDLKPYVYNGFRKCLAEALKVKPLQPVPESGGFSMFTAFGKYHVTETCSGSWCMVFQERTNPWESIKKHELDSKSAAIECCQQDHDSRVRVQLVYGG